MSALAANPQTIPVRLELNIQRRIQARMWLALA